MFCLTYFFYFFTLYTCSARASIRYTQPTAAYILIIPLLDKYHSDLWRHVVFETSLKMYRFGINYSKYVQNAGITWALLLQSTLRICCALTILINNCYYYLLYSVWERFENPKFVRGEITWQNATIFKTV